MDSRNKSAKVAVIPNEPKNQEKSAKAVDILNHINAFEKDPHIRPFFECASDQSPDQSIDQLRALYDIGCNNGLVTKELAIHFNMHVIGVDCADQPLDVPNWPTDVRYISLKTLHSICNALSFTIYTSIFFAFKSVNPNAFATFILSTIFPELFPTTLESIL